LIAGGPEGGVEVGFFYCHRRFRVWGIGWRSFSRSVESI
jgi:hypothetical protein